MDRKITIKDIMKVFAFVSGLLCCASANAGFNIVGEMDNDLGPHGIAEIDDFNRAILRTVKEEDEDKQFMAGITPVRTKDFWYLRLRAAPWGNAQIESLEIKKIDVPPTQKYKSRNADGRPKAYVGSLAGGYSFGDFSLELEGFFPKLVSYRINPLTPFTANGLDVRLQVATVFANIEYSFMNFSAVDALAHVVGFHPYLAAGVGGSWNSTKAKMYDVNGKINFRRSTKKKNLAANIGAGIRWNFAEYWYWDISYRYAQVGKHKVEPINGFTVDGSSMISRGYYLGIMYQI